MGCDIHLRAEVRQADKWVCAEETEGFKTFQDGRVFDKFEIEHPEYVDRFFDDRNYQLFAVLAGVRNAWDLTPIAEPRGLPQDISERAIAEHESDYDDGNPDARIWLGDHSWTWLTLEELERHDWDRKFVDSGILSLEEYDAWKLSENSAPAGWCRGISGPRVVISAEEGPLKPNTSHLVCKWEQTQRAHIGERWFEFMARLHRLGAPADVRLVFGFDS